MEPSVITGVVIAGVVLIAIISTVVIKARRKRTTEQPASKRPWEPTDIPRPEPRTVTETATRPRTTEPTGNASGLIPGVHPDRDPKRSTTEPHWPTGRHAIRPPQGPGSSSRIIADKKLGYVTPQRDVRNKPYFDDVDTPVDGIGRPLAYPNPEQFDVNDVPAGADRNTGISIDSMDTRPVDSGCAAPANPITNDAPATRVSDDAPAAQVVNDSPASPASSPASYDPPAQPDPPAPPSCD